MLGRGWKTPPMAHTRLGCKMHPSDCQVSLGMWAWVEQCDMGGQAELWVGSVAQHSGLVLHERCFAWAL